MGMDYLRYISSSGYVTGLMSGIDTGNIVDQLAEAKRVPITQLESRKAGEQATLAAYQSLGAGLLSLGIYAANLTTESTFQARQVINSDPDRVAASASAGTSTGTYELVISQLAQAHKVSSAAITDATAGLGYAGDIVINATAIQLQASDSLTNLVEAINNADTGVQASLLTISDSDHRLVLTANQSGAEGAIDLVEANTSNILEQLGLVQAAATTKHSITDGQASDYFASTNSAIGNLLGLSDSPSGTIQVNGTDVAIDLSADSLQAIAAKIDTVDGVTATVTGDGETGYRLEIVGDSGAPTLTDNNNVLQALGVLTKPVANEIDAALDAQFTLEDFALTRPTNSIDDVVPGLSLELLAADPETTVTLTVSPYYSDAVEAVASFVSKYNEIMDMLNAGLSYDVETETGGEFFGEAAIVNLQTMLVQQATTAVTTLAAMGESIALSELGLSVDADGRLALDTAQLQEVLGDDPVRVQRLLGNTVWGTESGVEFVSLTAATKDSGVDGYALNITQVATQATATSAEFAGGVIGQAETLTFDGTYQITLEAGWTISQAVDALNSFFETHQLSLTTVADGNTFVISHDLYGSNYDLQIASSLDDGAGGSDLGGPTAGEVATYTGQDVAGSINGETATGNGQYLTGGSDNLNTAGLMLKITVQSTGDKGTVYVSKGLGGRLNDLAEAMTQESRGSLALGQQAVTDRIDVIDDEIERLEDQIDTYVEQLQRRFIFMEQTLARMQTLGSWLSLQMDALMNMYRDNK